MWEVPTTKLIKNNHYRITPTYVGSTDINAAFHGLDRDHPHVCGKYEVQNIIREVSVGSPPRMWEVLSFTINS